MKRFHTRLPGSVQKIRLDHFLADWLPSVLDKPFSRTKIRTLLFAGGVYVNRHRQKLGTTPLFSGAIVEAYIDEELLNQNEPIRIDETRLESGRVMYEDEWLIVYDKPSGLPTQPTVDRGRANLFDLMKKYLNEREGMEDHYVGLHHRLDKDTSGLVLFTKKEEANKGVADLFSKHGIEKNYQCMVWRSPDSSDLEVNDQFTIENYLGKISAKSQNSKFGSVNSGGDHAITHFRVIEKFRDAFWLEASPKTGRTHQIRVHCSESGMPIFGDVIYFPEKVSFLTQAPRLLLHAYRLTFEHPITAEPVEILASLPHEFMQVLALLK
jgi:RluA family pseudouridine synthase